MALFLKVSNSLESLAAGLAENLSTLHSGVFDPYYIITQTEGMNNWLKLQLAGHLGITANCRFLKPNEFVNHLYYLLDGPSMETLSRENLSWLLFKLLGEKEFTKKFPEIAGYYQYSTSGRDLRRMALAEKVADLFDQYQIYRPEMIQQWSQTPLTSVPADQWQQYLWASARAGVGDALPDKTIVGGYILTALKTASQGRYISRRLPAVHLFGLSIITAYHIELLFELSAHTDVYFHLINPAPSVYWLEDRSEKQLSVWRQKGRSLPGAAVGNALLTGWGRVIQDTFGLLFSHDEFLNAYEELELVPPVPDSLLHKLQYDVFMAATTDRQSLLPEDIRDDSIHINSCYTIAREVEVLYNYLVHLVDKKEAALSPRDIVVMVSDIDTYAPYIKAVFNNAPYPFRYTIADESFTDGNNLFTALHEILRLNEENFKAEDVLQLLDSAYIRRRFGITDPDHIRRIVDAAGIRFGIQGNRDDDTYLVSWSYGLRRIMYGICISGEDRYGEGEDAFYPLDITEGGEALEVIRFCHFVEVLMASIRERKTNRSITDWVAYIEAVVHNMIFEPEEDMDEQYDILMRQLSELNLAGLYMPDTLAFEVFSHNLRGTLDSTTRASLFAGGGITFCSLIPMRSIPFRVVAMMGLNYDKFPRREKSMSFNLMEMKRQRGDRNVKENDKHLFLETVLSARDYLYISYLGQHPSDNTVLPPSALIDELIDYIEAGAQEPDEVRPLLITRQPLQGFSRKYTPGNERLYSYLDIGIQPVPPLTLTEKSAEGLKFEEIQLDELVRFFKNPFKAYYNKVLGIYYDDEQILLPETELFDLDRLQQWNLKQLLLPESDPAHLEESLVKTGQLPLKNMASVALRQVDEMVAPVRALYAGYTKGAEGVQQSLNIRIGETLLTGILQPVFEGKLLQVSWSKNETKYLVEAYIRYLAGAAAGLLSGLAFLSGSKHLKIVEAIPLSKKEASRRLAELLEVYKDGFKSMVPFYPDFKIDAETVEQLTTEEFSKMVDQALNNYQFPCKDPYIMPEYRKGFFDEEEKLAEFKVICQKIIIPLQDFFPDYFA
jgi:exodeoxyribonuclease V gamma subunit